MKRLFKEKEICRNSIDKNAPWYYNHLVIQLGAERNSPPAVMYLKDNESASFKHDMVRSHNRRYSPDDITDVL